MSGPIPPQRQQPQQQQMQGQQQQQPQQGQQQQQGQPQAPQGGGPVPQQYTNCPQCGADLTHHIQAAHTAMSASSQQQQPAAATGRRSSNRVNNLPRNAVPARRSWRHESPN
jgi:hypothetical protein